MWLFHFVSHETESVCRTAVDMFLHSSVLVLHFMLMLELTVIRQINIFVIWNVETQSCWLQVLIIGAGPCGLRTAIEAQLLGAKVVIVEKRDRISRNNVLHLWPFVIQDLRALGAKKFFGKFCAGSIDHISKCVNTVSYGSFLSFTDGSVLKLMLFFLWLGIRQLQCILLKVALILGVEIHEGVSFERLLPPPDEQSHDSMYQEV